MSLHDISEKSQIDPAKPSERRKFNFGSSTFGLVIVLTMFAVSVVLGWSAWSYYVLSPWTRDGRVRVYTAQVAPEVAGRIMEVAVADNQGVKKGDILFRIDDRDYKDALDKAEAAVSRARANMVNSQIEADRRNRLDDLAVSREEQQKFQAIAAAAEADYRSSVAVRNDAALQFERTVVRSPVDGFVTNLLLHVGTYATAGRSMVTLVDASSFWIAAYFEETQLKRIRVGDLVRIKLMAYPGQTLDGHVESFSRGIVDANANSGVEGLPTVDPVFTWVRLAQRLPVRVKIDRVPELVELAAGMTATVQVMEDLTRSR